MDATEHAVEYLLDMDLGNNGGRLLAREIDEVERWVAQERDFWNWLIEAQRAAEISRIASTYLDRFQQLIKRLSEWKNTSNNDAFASLPQNMYGNEKLLHSNP